MFALFCLEVVCALRKLSDSVFFGKNLKGFLCLVKSCEKDVIQINVRLKKFFQVNVGSKSICSLRR